MNKIYIIYDYKNTPFFYLESPIINEEWLVEHDYFNFDIVFTILDVDHYELLYKEQC